MMAVTDRLRGRWPQTLLRRLSVGGGAQLDAEQHAVLLALQDGCHLKVHRTLDGAKTYRLHYPLPAEELRPLREDSKDLPAATVEFLERHGYLQSNMKFPAATLLLTELGRQTARAAGATLNPVGPHRF
jgi:hypothetical protein